MEASNHDVQITNKSLVINNILAVTPNKKQLNHLGGGIFISAELTLISISGRPVFLCFVFSFEISGASDSSFSSSSLSSSLKYSNPVYRKSFNPY